MKRILDLLFFIHTDDGRDEAGDSHLSTTDMIVATELSLYQIKDTLAKFPNLFVLDEQLMNAEFAAEAEIYLYNMMDFADHVDDLSPAFVEKYPIISHHGCFQMLKHLGELMFKMD